MKKFVTIIMMVIALMSAFGAHAEVTDDLVKFCEGFDTEYVECNDGKIAVYHTVNDTLHHVIGIYADSVDSEEAVIKVYQHGYCAPENLVGGGWTVNSENFENTMYDIIWNLYNIEAAELDYAAGKVSEDYLEAMLFKYRMTVCGY